MSTLGNIVWIIFGGLFSALGYAIAGVLLCITIIGIPFGLQSFRLASAVLAPFGKTLVSESDKTGVLKTLFDILWLIFFGWEIALVHLLSGIILAITIIGIPFAIQHFKLVPLALLPFHYRLQ